MSQATQSTTRAIALALDSSQIQDEKSTLPTVAARGKAGFPAEESREMAGTGVAYLEGNGHNTLLGFAEQSWRSIHPQIDVIARR